MLEVTRYDAARPMKATRTDAGWLKATGSVTRVGVLTYQGKDGTVRRELRPPEEVCAPASLATLAMVPVTREHPPTPTGLLDAKTAKQFTIGYTGERVDVEGDYVNTTVLLTDADGIADAEGELSQLSAGYRLKLDPTPGVHPIYGPYDAVQRDIRYNHVAITRAGRAGPEVRLHLDSADAIEVADVRQDSAPMEKVVIAGVEYEVTKQAAQAFAAELARKDSETARKDSEVAALKTARDQAQARADAAETARADAADPSKVQAAVKARLDLERKAGAILGDAVKLDALTDVEVMTQAVAKASPGMADKLKGQTPAYVAAAFDFAVASFKPAPAAPAAKVAGARTDDAGSDSRTDAESARKAMIDANRKAGLEPIPFAATRAN